MRRIGGVAAELLISVGVLALTLAAVFSVARRAAFYPDAFAEHLADSVADPRVASFVAEKPTVAILRAEPDLTAFRPIILATARGAVSSSAFQALVRTTAHAAHTSLFSEGGRKVFVSVPDVGVLLKNALARTNPALAAKIPARVQGILVSVSESRFDHSVTLAAAFVAAIAHVGRPRGVAARPATDACNGAPELCGRRLDEIVFPGTHNSMSAADVPGWLLPEQEMDFYRTGDLFRLVRALNGLEGPQGVDEQERGHDEQE